MPDSAASRQRGYPSGNAWVPSALKRVLGFDPKLRRGGRLPEEIPAPEIRRYIAAIQSRFMRTEDQETGRITYPLSIGRAAPEAPEAGPVVRLARQVETLKKLLAELEPLCDPCDSVEPFAALIENALTGLAAELSREPLPCAVDEILRNLGKYITNYQVEANLGPPFARTLEDLAKVEKLDEFRDHYKCLRFAWKSYKGKCVVSRMTSAAFR